ncbi:uncharacterized protein YifB-like [Penaeus monodon]|uniref:uncharacterized protein YifB-like n=1 Tax=Penaeus monodon TaxID=6687 RepID=UPI0018A7DBE4|nr:uncharacterized protein YifB-like [Penaeus monodon]
MGKLEQGQPLMAKRPFRSPHHTISEAGLVGGGSPPSPGEISLSHNGVLFLDELPEFNRRTLERPQTRLQLQHSANERYMAKISGPLLDRIDVHLEVPAVDFKELSSSVPGTSTAEMNEMVTSARRHQLSRFEDSRVRCNGQMNSRQIRKFCKLDGPSETLLHNTVNEMGLSARAHDKILRVARTIADIEDAPEILIHHLSEAINYRILDRDMWK